MPDDHGGAFSGDGSVRWRVRTRRDKNPPGDPKVIDQPDGNGRRNMGFDDEPGDYFKLIMRPPAGMSAADMIARLGKLQPVNGRVEFLVPIDQAAKQIQVLWAPNLDGQKIE